jgi:hypothetical protein
MRHSRDTERARGPDAWTVIHALGRASQSTIRSPSGLGSKGEFCEADLDAAATERERAAAMLGRWIISTHPAELHVRHLQREVRLQGLRTAEQVRAAAGVLVEADWLQEPAPGHEFGQRGRIAYAVNPRLWEVDERTDGLRHSPHYRAAPTWPPRSDGMGHQVP